MFSAVCEFIGPEKSPNLNTWFVLKAEGRVIKSSDLDLTIRAQQIQNEE
jgi:hypothetical protein